MADTCAWRYNTEIFKRALSPFQKFVTLFVTFHFNANVFFKGFGTCVFVDHNRVVNDQINRRQRVDGFSRADVVLVGISRTSKTPTCMYLANRGLKAANIPLVPGIALPDELTALDDVLIVGLTAAPERLVEIRRNRLKYLHQDTDTDYVDMQAVNEEVINARRLFNAKGWPRIDVTRRSIEDTAAAIIGLHTQFLEDRAEAQAH